MNECYTKSKDWWNINLLYYDVMQGSRHLTTIELMNVGTAELNLDAGRFKNFTREEQAHSVSIRIDGNGEEMKRRMDELVTWIEGQAGKWSFDPGYESIGKMNVNFTFEDVVTAVTFKLVWYNG